MQFEIVTGMILLLIPLIIALVILLQIFLSRRKNKWFGLILPGISGTFSIITILGAAIYFGCREKLKKTKEIEKMNIQDLE